MKRQCALGLLLHWLGPVGLERAQPISAFRPMIEMGDSSPPFIGAALPVDSARQAATRRTRWCRGGTLDQGKPMGGSRADAGSP
jgi:hypothetical protein